MWRLLMILTILLTSWCSGQWNRPRAYACGGGAAATVDELLSWSSHVIKGRIVTSDAANQNHIVQVEEYLVGEPGPEYILVSQNRPANIQGLYDGLLGNGDCNSLQNAPPVDHSFYMFVQRSLEGAYVQVGKVNSSADWYVFPTPDSTLDLTRYDPDSMIVDTTVTEVEFHTLLADLSGDEADPPLPDQPYPHTSPGLITTTAGTQYLLPVDSSDPVPITDSMLAVFLTSGADPLLMFANSETCWGHFPSDQCTLEVIDGRFVRQVINGEPGLFLGPYGYPWFGPPNVMPTFAPDSEPEDIVVVTDDFTLKINDIPIILDLDAPIQEFRWLPSFFWGD